MKKNLYLIRHAVAEDGGNTPMFRDFDRDLTSTGIIEAARMGKFLAEKNTKFDLVVSSAAERAKATAKIFAEQVHYEADEIVLDEALYGGGARAYLLVVNQLDEAANNVAIFGHNPDVTFFSEYLTRDDIGGTMETAGVIILAFDDVKWADVSSKMGKLVAYHSPKTIKENAE